MYIPSVSEFLRHTVLLEVNYIQKPAMNDNNNDVFDNMVNLNCIDDDDDYSKNFAETLRKHFVLYFLLHPPETIIFCNYYHCHFLPKR